MPLEQHDPPISRRRRTVLVAKDETVLFTASTGPLDFDFLIEQLDADPSVTIRQRLAPRNFRAQALGTSITDQVIVATVPDTIAEDLARHPQVIVEEDSLILPRLTTSPAPVTDPALLSPYGTSTTWTIALRGSDNQPVAGASVYLYGTGVPAQGRTDAEGTVTLDMLNETDETIRAIYVNPQSDYWSAWIDRPQLTSGATTTIRMTSLNDSFPGFPQTELLGWGQRAMRLDEVPPGFTGRGVKVAVVDSGAAALTHPDLSGVRDGVDLTSTPSNTEQWKDDTIAHGSHCSGVIAGARNGTGVRGFASEVEVHEARIFPGGRISSLIDAIDYCIDQGIDVVNMSLGTGGSSQILLQKLAQAKDLGVACIVAAGNTGAGVQFPGTSPDVLTVAAIGKDGEFPESSYHAQQRWKSGRGDGGYFSAQFSCHGEQVDVCGPGVAIVSSVPPRGFAAWDGTSMATPHVTGLAALVLAHHPDFQSGPFTLRGAARVEHLFTLLKASATSLQFGDPERSGAGLPDAPRALGLQAGHGDADAGDLSAQPSAIQTALAQLGRELVSVGLIAEAMCVEPPALHTAPSIRRSLELIRARMSACGLPIERPAT